MKYLATLWILALSSCSYAQRDQEKAILVGGPCEGCEAVFEYDGGALNPVDTISGFETYPAERLKITGVIYKADGKTPAPEVILYLYHTNPDGVYPTRGGETGWGRRHGYLRGWIKTGADGRYTFYTSRPGAYGAAAEHVHPILLEPDGRYYWIDEYHFTDDPLFKTSEGHTSRGGNGVSTPSSGSDGLVTIRRDIILGLNVPDY